MVHVFNVFLSQQNSIRFRIERECLAYSSSSEANKIQQLSREGEFPKSSKLSSNNEQKMKMHERSKYHHGLQWNDRTCP